MQPPQEISPVYFRDQDLWCEAFVPLVNYLGFMGTHVGVVAGSAFFIVR